MENLKLCVTDNSGSEPETTTEESEQEVEEDEKEFSTFEEENCLFCAAVSETLDPNITHMQNSHAQFLPSIDTLRNSYSSFRLSSHPNHEMR